MAKVVTDDKHYHDIGDAIRAKNGEATQYKPSEMAEAIGALPSGGGDTAIEDGMVNGTLTAYTNDRVESVRDYAFAYTGVETVNLPNAKTIGKNVFSGSKVTDLHFPNAITLGAIGSGAANLNTLDAPKATSVADSFLMGNKAITTVNLPSLVTLAKNAFYGCNALTYCNLQSVTNIAHVGQTFTGVPMEVLDFPSLQYIPQDAFGSNTTVNTLILRKTGSICSLSSATGFLDNFKTTGKGGTVYVPAALIEQYQNATNWSTLYAAGTCNFVAIEGSEYE